MTGFDANSSDPKSSDKDLLAGDPQDELEAMPAQMRFRPLDFWQRSRWIILAVVLSLLVAPKLTFGLRAFEGIVLKIDPVRAEMLVGFLRRPPEWIEVFPKASAGLLVTKSMGTWEPVFSQPKVGDASLARLYLRYAETYQGVIQSIDAPRMPGAPYIAVLQANQKTRRVPLWGAHLADAQVGATLQKQAGMWDPVLVPTGSDDHE